MQHLKVIGEDPTAVFIPSKEEEKKEAKEKKGIKFIVIIGFMIYNTYINIYCIIYLQIIVYKYDNY